MGDLATIEKKSERELQVVNDLDDLLGINNYLMLKDNSIFFKNNKGKHVIFRIDPNAIYSKRDFMKLPEGAPFELLNGKLTLMPSPIDIHQNILGNIFLSLGFFVKMNKLGVLRTAPLDVHFDKKNIVQPDLLFVSNERKNIIKDWVFGAPDIVIEICSPSTKKKDRTTKFKLYQKHGVREYWMVDVDSKTVEVQILKEKKFALKEKYTMGSELESDVVVGFKMAIADIFETTH